MCVCVVGARLLKNKYKCLKKGKDKVAGAWEGGREGGCVCVCDMMLEEMAKSWVIGCSGCYSFSFFSFILTYQHLKLLPVFGESSLAVLMIGGLTSC